jgi:hypothetical protein
MSLSCFCDYEPEPGHIVWEPPRDYTLRHVMSRAPRCACCGAQIAPLALMLVFRRFKIPDSDLECTLYGCDGEIPRAPHHLCEACGDQFFNLTELGFCFDYRETMAALVEYRELQGGK